MYVRVVLHCRSTERWRPDERLRVECPKELTTQEQLEEVLGLVLRELGPAGGLIFLWVGDRYAGVVGTGFDDGSHALVEPIQLDDGKWALLTLARLAEVKEAKKLPAFTAAPCEVCGEKQESPLPCIYCMALLPGMGVPRKVARFD